MLTISGLYIYPIKSLGGVAVQQSLVTDRGLQYDRRWMLVDESYVAITQRSHPRMALLDVELRSETLEVTDRTTKQSISLPLQPEYKDTFMARLWDDDLPVQGIDLKADEWFSDLLSFKCRLVYMPDDSIRKVEPTSSTPDAINNLSDDYPVMMLGEESLADLNTKLLTPVPMDRFRPNLIVTGGAAFEEDHLTNLTINGLSFTASRTCTRCVLVTIDKATGTRSDEPLKTLATYRRSNNKVHFGQYLIPNGQGSIAIGQTIVV